MSFPYLKNCPFCASPALYFEVEYLFRPNEWQCGCGKNGCFGWVKASISDTDINRLAERWNTRPVDNWIEFEKETPPIKGTYICTDIYSGYTQILLWIDEQFEDMQGYIITGITHYTAYETPRKKV